MRLFQRLSVVALASFTAFLTSCGQVSSRIEVSLKDVHLSHTQVSPNVWLAGNLAADRQLRSYIFASRVAASISENSSDIPTSGSSEPTSVPTPPSEMAGVGAATSPFPCIAEAETGTDWTMHGSTYSTAYGVINDIVYEYASPDVQARIFSGTATPAEQTDVVARFAADHGFGGWGERTKEVCGL